MDSLLERDDQLAALAEVVEAARDGRGRIVLLGGEAGIGKTSLVRALHALAPHGVAFLAGACEPLSVPVSLAPLRGLAEPARWPWLQPPPDGPRVAPERLAEVERATGMVRHGPPPPAR